ncbi:putative aryl-alcohol protein [Neofusicoccum parvum UCRNP2]|uniref:Putative aryl-alcohol protein n=1 Tax=Botryosphaeria parva (strain UCR-NP2) TaxID=1287680 RepID=R1GD09_BOTPV|nr:putative aryl-alcohol protein [Neofusicoccum parvum UCRNP2]
MATEREEYDFIVVGGGTAGLVVAARLTEDESKSVLVIEAGANRKGDAKIDTPGMMTSLYDDPDYDWAFMTEPQLDEYMEDKLQGTTGPLQVTIPDGYSSFHEAWMQTFQELGFNTADDPIGGEKLGAFTNPVSIHPTSKTREYSASSYLSDAVIGRPNLHVRTETTVEKINLESGPDGSVTATGVQVLTKGGDRKVFQVKPEGEVILAAGAIKSPQLLELSGIGNREILSEHGIPLLVDLPGVGQNLQDHVFSSISYEIADNQMSGDCLRNPSILQTVLQQYQVSRSGPMAGTLLSSAYLPTTSDASALSPDAFSFYDLLHAWHRSGIDLGTLSTSSTFIHDAAWGLDKWKFLPLAQHALATAPPQTRWIVFAEADTALVWSNVLRWLARLDAGRAWYLGGPAWLDGAAFAHGGSGYVLSRPALEMLVAALDAEPESIGVFRL